MIPLNDIMNNQQKRDYNEAFIDNRARHIVSLGRPPHIFQVGDLVRIKLLLLSSRMRQQRENGIGWNKVAVHFSPQIYQVVNVFHHAPNFTRREEYSLQDNAGNLLMSGAVPKRFFGNDLILVPPNHIPTHILPQTTDRALRLNRFR